MICKRAIDRLNSLTALGIIPAEVNEKILNVIKNNIGIKARPFSAIGKIIKYLIKILIIIERQVDFDIKRKQRKFRRSYSINCKMES